MQDKELNIGDLSRGMTNFIKKNWYFLLLFIALGFLFGYYSYTQAKPSYQTNVYAKSSFVPLDLIKNEIYSINSWIEEGNTQNLLEKMNLDTIAIPSYVSFKFFNVSDGDNIFSIQVKSSGENNTNSKLVEGFTDYLESNPFLGKFLEEQRQLLIYNDEVYKEELAHLILIQESLISEAKPINKNLISDPASISNKIIDLKRSIQLNALKLEEVGAFKVIDSVDIVSSPSLKKSLFSSIIIFTFLGSFLLLTFRLFSTKP